MSYVLFAMSSTTQWRAARMMTSWRLYAPRHAAVCPRTLYRLARRNLTTPTLASASSPTIIPAATTIPLSSSSSPDSSSSSSTSPPPPRRPSSALRYLIVSAASFAVGAMLASVSEPLQQLNTLRHSTDTLHTLINTTHAPPALPASAPAWAVQLAVNETFDYKDVTAVFPTANHLIYDSLRADNRVQHVYHFITKKQPAIDTQPQPQPQQQQQQQQPEVHVLFELGTALCGHAGIVHGGLTASLIDQISGETAFLSTGPGSFTANLNVNYLKPLIAGRWVEVVGRVVGVEGRKVRVRVEVSEGAVDERVVYATGDVLFVRPKWIPEQTSEWKISASSVQREQEKETAQQQQQQQNILKTG